MPESRRYVVTQPFTISYENGKQSIDVAAGDVIMFDGFNFQVGDVSGMSSSLKVVVRAGEWVVPEDGEETAELHQKPVVTQTRSYNATGGVQVEMSDPAEDMNLYQGRRGAQTAPQDDLGAIVRDFEQRTEKNGATVVTSDEGDLRKEVQRPAPKIVLQDVREVSKVRDTTAQTSSGAVTAAQPKEGKRPVVQGQRMAKQTAPATSPDTYKHIKVDVQAAGTVVGKVTDRSDATMIKRTAASDKRPVVQHQTVAKVTARPASQRTDVGSSTQAAVERQRDVAPEVTVVSTVRDEYVTASKDGIKSTMTVRASDEFGEGLVTSSSAEGGVELADGGDLDVSDILQDS